MLGLIVRRGLHTGRKLNLVYIGAGGINFGSHEGPWNHSLRIENKLGPNLNVTALIDPDVTKAAQILKTKDANQSYQNTKIFKSVAEYIAADLPKNEIPDAAIIGVPPAYHGSIKKGANIEVELAERFPKVAMFIDKPVSSSSVKDVRQVSSLLKGREAITSVGYMMRYLKAVEHMKKIIETNNLRVMATVARYACAYTSIQKDHWWDKRISCGPIIEQGTHFADLSRFFGGKVDLDSVQAHTVDFNEPAGRLKGIPIDESKISPEDRIPRVTTANWKYEGGAIGSITHLLALHDVKFETELEVFADGWLFRLSDPYYKPTLSIRSPGAEAMSVETFLPDDPYQTQFDAFIDAIYQKQQNLCLSSFDDAIDSYALTWAIRNSSESNSNKRLLRDNAGTDSTEHDSLLDNPELWVEKNLSGTRSQTEPLAH